MSSVFKMSNQSDKLKCKRYGYMSMKKDAYTNNGDWKIKKDERATIGK